MQMRHGRAAAGGSGRLGRRLLGGLGWIGGVREVDVWRIRLVVLGLFEGCIDRKDGLGRFGRKKHGNIQLETWDLKKEKSTEFALCKWRACQLIHDLVQKKLSRPGCGRDFASQLQSGGFESLLFWHVKDSLAATAIHGHSHDFIFWKPNVKVRYIFCVIG